MNLLFKLLDPRKIIASFTLYMGGGGSPSSPSATSQSNTVSNIAPWAQAGVQQLIQSGLGNYFPQYGQELAAYNANPYDPVTNPNGVQAPTNLGSQAGYTPFDPTNPTNNSGMASAITAGKNSVANFQPLQNQSYTSAANMALPNQYGQATDLATQAGQGNLGTVAGANQYGQAGYNAGMAYGQNAANQTDANGNVTASGTVQNYMNPYLSATLNPSLALMNQQYGMQNVANNAQATQAGAFGGSRMGVQNALTNQAQNLAQNQLIGNAYNQAYNTANTNMQQAATLGMQGAATGLQGVSGQQAGYNGAGSQATNLGSLGTQQLAGQQSIAGLQNAYGAQQQQQAQNQINQGAQNYSTQQAVPMQQLQQLEGLYTGAPTSTTTSNYSAAPSILSQAAGLGMAGYGLSQLGSNTSSSKAKGGRIKGSGIDKLPAKNLESFKKGGITMDAEDDGAVHFADNKQQPVGSYESGPFTAADYSLGTQDPRTYRDSQLNPSQKFNLTQLQLLEQSPGSGASLTGYPSVNSGAVLGGQQYPKLSPGVLSQFLQAQQNLPDASPTANGPTSMDNIAANGTPSGPQQAPAPYNYKAPQMGLPNLLPTGSMSAEEAKKNSTQFLNPAALNEEAKNLDSYFENQINARRTARDAALAGRPTLGKKQEERLNKEDEKDVQRLSNLKSSSMLEAGLAVLGGTSPFFGPNISNAKEGIQAYKAGLKDLDKAKEARENVRGNIEMSRDAQLNHDVDSSLQFEDNAFNAHMGLKGHLFDAKNNMNTAFAGIASGMFQNDRNNANANQRANLGAMTDVAKTNALLSKEPEAITTARILGNGDVQSGYNMGIAKQHATELYTKWSQLAYPNGTMGQPNEAFLKAYPTAQLFVEEGLSSAGFAPQTGNAGGYGNTPPPSGAAVINSKR